MLQIKLDNSELRSKLFIDSIKLAVNRHRDNLHLHRLKTLSHHSNVLLEGNSKEHRKMKTQPEEILNFERKKRYVTCKNTIQPLQSQASTIPIQANLQNMKFKGSVPQTPFQNNLQRHFQYKSLRKSLIMISLMNLKENNNEESNSKRDSKSSASNESIIEQNYKKANRVNRKKDISKHMFPSPINLPKIKNYCISYKEVLFGKSLQVNQRSLKEFCSEGASIRQSKSFEKPKPSNLLPLINGEQKKLQYLDHPKHKRDVQKQKIDVSLPRSKKNQPCQELHFSPWSTKQSVFRLK